jgi:hypothetical protein
MTITPPTITFGLADGATLHKTQNMVLVPVHVTSPDSVASSSVNGGYSGVNSRYNPPVPFADVNLHFYVHYFPVGDYKFTATATDTKGVQSSKTITLHLVE